MRSMIIPKKNIRDSFWRQRNKKSGGVAVVQHPCFLAVWRGIEDSGVPRLRPSGGIEDSELNSCDLAGD